MRVIPLISGSSGNATYVEAGGRRMLIDAGVSAKRITELLYGVGVDAAVLDAILVTHEHSDHVAGLPMLSKKYGIPVYIAEECFRSLPEGMRAKLPLEHLRLIEPDMEFFIGSARVLPFSTYHGSLESIRSSAVRAICSVGFCISEGRTKFTLLTDCGHIDARLLGVCAGSALLLLESNYDEDMLLAGRYPYALKHRILSGKGHLSNAECAKTVATLARQGLGNVILGHLSEENNTPELARITVESALKTAGIDGVSVFIAERHEPTGVFDIG